MIRGKKDAVSLLTDTAHLLEGGRSLDVNDGRCLAIDVCPSSESFVSLLVNVVAEKDRDCQSQCDGQAAENDG